MPIRVTVVHHSIAVVVDAVEAVVQRRGYLPFTRAPSVPLRVTRTDSSFAYTDVLGAGGTGVAGLRLTGGACAIALRDLTAVGGGQVTIRPTRLASVDHALPNGARRKGVHQVARCTTASAILFVVVGVDALRTAAGWPAEAHVVGIALLTGHTRAIGAAVGRARCCSATGVVDARGRATP